MKPELSALILAAGAGTRFGMPKALAQTGGRSWLDLAVSKCRLAGYDPICVVVGCRAAEVKAACTIASSDPGVVWIQNEAWEQGRTGGIICGLKALDQTSTSADGVLIFPVDFPFVQGETLTHLSRRFGESGPRRRRIFLPLQNGKRGHPVVVGRDIWAEILSLGPDQPLREVVHGEPSRTIEVEVADEGIHRDINDPGELERK